VITPDVWEETRTYSLSAISDGDTADYKTISLDLSLATDDVNNLAPEYHPFRIENENVVNFLASSSFKLVNTDQVSTEVKIIAGLDSGANNAMVTVYEKTDAEHPERRQRAVLQVVLGAPPIGTVRVDLSLLPGVCVDPSSGGQVQTIPSNDNGPSKLAYCSTSSECNTGEETSFVCVLLLATASASDADGMTSGLDATSFLEFGEETWSTPQFIKVEAIDDNIQDPVWPSSSPEIPLTGLLTLSPASASDSRYAASSGLARQVTVLPVDDDSAGLSLSFSREGDGVISGAVSFPENQERVYIVTMQLASRPLGLVKFKVGDNLRFSRLVSIEDIDPSTKTVIEGAGSVTEIVLFDPASLSTGGSPLPSKTYAYVLTPADSSVNLDPHTDILRLDASESSDLRYQKLDIISSPMFEFLDDDEASVSVTAIANEYVYESGRFKLNSGADPAKSKYSFAVEVGSKPNADVYFLLARPSNGLFTLTTSSPFEKIQISSINSDNHGPWSIKLTPVGWDSTHSFNLISEDDDSSPDGDASQLIALDLQVESTSSPEYASNDILGRNHCVDKCTFVLLDTEHHMPAITTSMSSVDIYESPSLENDQRNSRMVDIKLAGPPLNEVTVQLALPSGLCIDRADGGSVLVDDANKPKYCMPASAVSDCGASDDVVCEPLLATLSRTSCTFAYATWDSGCSVEITAVVDHVVDPLASLTSMLSIGIVTSDERYADVVAPSVPVSIVNSDTASFNVVLPDAFALGQDGQAHIPEDVDTPFDITVSLTSRPLSHVVYEIGAVTHGTLTLRSSSGDYTEISENRRLVFLPKTADDWSVAADATFMLRFTASTADDVDNLVVRSDTISFTRVTANDPTFDSTYKTLDNGDFSRTVVYDDDDIPAITISGPLLPAHKALADAGSVVTLTEGDSADNVYQFALLFGSRPSANYIDVRIPRPAAQGYTLSREIADSDWVSVTDVGESDAEAQYGPAVSSSGFWRIRISSSSWTKEKQYMLTLTASGNDNVPSDLLVTLQAFAAGGEGQPQEYASLHSSALTFTVLDTENPAILAEPVKLTNNIAVGSGGADSLSALSYNIRLKTPPVTNKVVTLKLSLSVDGEGSLSGYDFPLSLSTSSLTFVRASDVNDNNGRYLYSLDRTVTVYSPSGANLEKFAYPITGFKLVVEVDASDAATIDPTYAAAAESDKTFPITLTDVPTAELITTSLAFNMADTAFFAIQPALGPSQQIASFTVALSSMPVNDIVIEISTESEQEASIKPKYQFVLPDSNGQPGSNWGDMVPLTFEARDDNYAVVKQVFVRVASSDYAVGTITRSISVVVKDGDANYVSAQPSVELSAEIRTPGGVSATLTAVAFFDNSNQQAVALDDFDTLAEGVYGEVTLTLDAMPSSNLHFTFEIKEVLENGDLVEQNGRIKIADSVSLTPSNADWDDGYTIRVEWVADSSSPVPKRPSGQYKVLIKGEMPAGSGSSDDIFATHAVETSFMVSVSADPYLIVRVPETSTPAISLTESAGASHSSSVYVKLSAPPLHPVKVAFELPSGICIDRNRGGVPKLPPAEAVGAVVIYCNSLVAGASADVCGSVDDGFVCEPLLATVQAKNAEDASPATDDSPAYFTFGLHNWSSEKELVVTALDDDVHDPLDDSDTAVVGKLSIKPYKA